MKDDGPINPADFRVPPEQMAEEEMAAKRAAKSSTPRKSRRGSKFIQLPKMVVIAIAQKNYPLALVVAAAIYQGWYEDYKKRNPVLVTSVLLAPYGISPDQKLRALKVLEATGHYTVNSLAGRNPLVMMKWIPPKELKP